jgi:hypothetical protein
VPNPNVVSALALVASIVVVATIECAAAPAGMVTVALVDDWLLSGWLSPSTPSTVSERFASSVYADGAVTVQMMAELSASCCHVPSWYGAGQAMVALGAVLAMNDQTGDWTVLTVEEPPLEPRAVTVQ